MRKRSFIPLFLLASLLTACNTLAPTLVPSPTATLAPTLTPPPQKVVTIENAGLICFREYDAITEKMAGTFVPKGCFSSSCTRPLEQTTKTDLNKGQRTLKFNTKFLLLDTTVRTTGAAACTADCAGGGEVPFKFTDIVTGTYSVILGEQNMGNLEVPLILKESAGVCFGELY